MINKFRTTGSIARGFLLTDALSLEGKVKSPLMILPSPEIVAGSPATFVDYYRIRIDPEKSKDTDKVVEFVFTDQKDQAVALHVRKGVVEYIPVPSKYLRKPDFTIEMNSKTWASIYLGTTDMSKAIQSKHIKLAKGDKAELISIFKMFDTFNPANNYKVPPIKG